MGRNYNFLFNRQKNTDILRKLMNNLSPLFVFGLQLMYLWGMLYKGK